MTALSEALIHEILKAAQAALPGCVAQRRYLHERPELSQEELATADYIEEQLRRMGLVPERVDGSGVYAEIHGTAPAVNETSAVAASRKVLLRADIDALAIQETSGLPFASQRAGVMHACGHDLHTAALLSAAAILCEKRFAFSGTIQLVFQQGEENGSGALQFLQAGKLEGTQAVFAQHIAPDVPLGQVALLPGACCAATDYFCITLHGRASHASKPQQGIDALYLGAQLVQALQALVTRHNDPLEAILIAVGRFAAGTTYNVVAENAELEGTCRTFSAATRCRVHEQIENCVRGLAAVAGATFEIKWKDYTSVLINDAAETAAMTALVRRAYGPEALNQTRGQTMGGDDFAEFLTKAPGCYMFVGVADSEADPRSALPLHSPDLCPSEAALEQMTALHVLAALDFLAR